MNVVAIQGRLARPAEQRVLPSGSRLVALEVTVRRDQGPAETAPVVWLEAPAWASALDADTPVLVVGRIRRRFFKAAGATQSRTEVVAERVVPGQAGKRVRAALAEVSARIEAAAASGAP